MGETKAGSAPWGDGKGVPRKIVARSWTIARSAVRRRKDLIDKRAFNSPVPLRLG